MGAGSTGNFSYPKHKLLIEVQGAVFSRGPSGRTLGVGFHPDCEKGQLTFSPYFRPRITGFGSTELSPFRLIRLTRQGKGPSESMRTEIGLKATGV